MRVVIAERPFPTSHNGNNALTKVVRFSVENVRDGKYVVVDLPDNIVSFAIDNESFATMWKFQ